MSKKTIIIIVIVAIVGVVGGIYGYSVYNKNKIYKDCVKMADGYWKDGVWGTDSTHIAEFVEDCAGY